MASLTRWRETLELEDTHTVNSNCDFSKLVYYGGNIEKYGELFPEWIHNIVNADITNKTIHQDEYFKFMKLGKTKRKEFVDFIRTVKIPKSMIYIDTDEPLNGKDNVAFISAEAELQHLTISEEVLGLNIQVTGKLLLYNRKWQEDLYHIRSKRISDYAFCNHWRKRIIFYNTLSFIFLALMTVWCIAYMDYLMSTEVIGLCDSFCYLKFFGVTLMCISFIVKIGLILPMFVFDAIDFEKWRYFWICSGTSFVGVCFYSIGLCLQNGETFKKEATNHVYIFGTVLWMIVMDVLIVERKAKLVIYYGWWLAFCLIHIVSSLLFLVFDGIERDPFTVEYVMAVMFIVALISYSSIFMKGLSGSCECCCGLGLLCGIFAFPMVSIWHFAMSVEEVWNEPQPGFVLVFNTIKTVQALGISIIYIAAFFYGCSKRNQ